MVQNVAYKILLFNLKLYAVEESIIENLTGSVKFIGIGIAVVIIGFIILLCIIPVYRNSHPKKEKNKKTINWGIVLTWTIGVIGSLIMGFGMSKITVGNSSASDMVVGLITGVIGLVTCVLNYPIYAYIKAKKEQF